MRRAVLLAAAAALMLSLAGCSREEFDPSALGWEEDWTARGHGARRRAPGGL